jgi:photosystem II stability/assembly factor-like uncharacterized protein
MYRFAKSHLLLAIVSTALLTTTAVAQYNPESFSAMKWRLVGPHRAGRVTAVAGIPGKPAIYYFGTPGGGVWKTMDGGRTWKPIFDDAHVASIGALALAPSNPNVIYVGTGEQLDGNGVYKSTDGGATWTNVGLQDTLHISSIIVDPRNPDIVLVATLGPFVPSQARGIFKTIDGGKTWSKVFFKDDKTLVFDMCAAPDERSIVYAATYTFPLDMTQRRSNNGESQIFKSTDSGATWQMVSGPAAGLPDNPRGRIGVAVAPGSKGQRVYAIMAQGFFRSDDGGTTWRQSTGDPRVIGSGYFSRVYVDPHNADVVFVMQTSTYRSTDGGKTFEAFKGEPSGEDDHVLWIDPSDSQRIFEGTDQGAVISLNGGRTWTEWFNQPTGEMYHVITDDAFPYRLYASQQDSGSVAVLSRSDFGMITYRDWFSTGAFESGYIAPDPVNPNLIYSVGWYGSVLRLDRTTGQISTVFAPGANYRYTWETPLVFSPGDPKALYVGMQNVLRTTDEGKTWQEISPDLTDKTPSPTSQGVIQTITPSAAQPGQIWVGASTGLVQLTRDNGANWSNVTPADLPANSNIILIEASPTDPETAYVITSARADLQPYIYRTHDAGKSWQKIVAGLPAKGVARVVREDPARKGLLYAGTENGVYVSFDGGDRWQPMQLNLPTTSVRDLNVHGNDLVAATYGRGLWILDDLAPLRQVNAEVGSAGARLFKPATAMRVRWDNYPDTPLPADTPAGENPPDGAIIYYYLKSNVAGEITLEIRDEAGATVRKFSSKAPPSDATSRNVPDYWFAPPDALTKNAGLNRFVWDMHWPHPDTLSYGFYGRLLPYIEYTFPDHAIAGRTPRDQPPGPLVTPGRYEIVLTVDGKTYRQPLEVKLDPRVRVPAADLAAQLNLARMIDAWMNTSFHSYNDVAALRAALAGARKVLDANPGAKEASETAAALDKELGEIQDGTNAAPGFGSVNRDLARYVTMIQGGDLRPAQSAAVSAGIACTALTKDLARWRTINAERVPAFNQVLKQAKLPPLATMKVENDPLCPN